MLGQRITGKSMVGRRERKILNSKKKIERGIKNDYCYGHI